MSMSEFEGRQYDGLENDLSHFSLSMQDKGIPDDFSEDDLAFAQELGELFSLDKEEIPPYFVQTLLESENPRFQPVEHGFEHKTRVRVFRRLKLRRRLFHTPRPSLPFRTRILPVQRSFVALVLACVLFMLATMVATSNSFAAGMAYLLSGQHSGVAMFSSYPRPTPSPKIQAEATHTPQNKSVAPHRMSLLETRQQLNFPIYWPTYLPSHYSPDSINLYKGSEQIWTDGPIMQLVCSYAIPGVQPHGTGRITIWEFKPLGDGRVLQGVQIGSSHQIKIGPNGQPGIVVNGQWRSINSSTQAWVDNGSVELIYERDGVIFWIQGDQKDGIDKDGKTLANIATSLTALDVSRISRMGRFDGVTQSVTDSAWTFAGEIYNTDILIVPGPNTVDESSRVAHRPS